MYYEFDCGCKVLVDKDRFEKKGKTLNWYYNNSVIPPVHLDITNVRKDCKKVWNMLAQGLTKGVFQLESPLGRQWCKKLKPESIEHLSALGALLRPGCLRSVDEKGVSMTEHYCRRKNKEEPVTYYHESLKPILRKTYGTLVFQEQAMEIARVIAGFTLQQADMLRKSMGKKLPEEMAKCKIMFIEGAIKTKIVNEEEAKEIFGWIEKSQRYSFNCSHSVSYAVNGYWSAFVKAHCPIYFFTSWLRFSKEKQKPLAEIKELVHEAKRMNVEVYTPDITQLHKHFYTNGKVIYFGITNVKDIGEAEFKKLTAAIKRAENLCNKTIDKFSWYDFVVMISDEVSVTTMNNLISVGAFKKITNGESFKNINARRVSEMDRVNGQGKGMDTESIQTLLFN